MSICADVMPLAAFLAIEHLPARIPGDHRLISRVQRSQVFNSKR
ncbi:hypothetical protein [Polaromonas sp.]|nr:hypothetical protein [Polaromonas sp.]